MPTTFATRGKRGAAALLALGALLALPACATAQRKPATARAAGAVDLRAAARAAGLDLADPLALDPEIVAEAERMVNPAGSGHEKLRLLVRYLNDSGRMNFQYTPHRSLTAREAFHERRGDCMAYTNLFVALARKLGVPAYFVHVSQVRNYYERAGWFFVSSHVAVGHSYGPNALVYDFNKELSDWQLAIYESIDDDAALALHYNNVAVDAMMAGRRAEAERLFTFLLAQRPDVPELYNNLGVLYNRAGRHDDALAVLRRGMARFPQYAPLYTNGLLAARGAGKHDLANEFERRGQELESTDPYFLFARAVTLYQKSHYEQAARQFERASSKKPDSPVILAWLSRAYLSAGRRAEGLEAFFKARKLAPGERILRELTVQFPELAQSAINQP
jgi:tetratricopeptide (TPR) repeat protein